MEDPNHRLDERREIYADGAHKVLPIIAGSIPEPHFFCERMISGGQTGADRAALDFAMQHRYPHGGWIPSGRQAEDDAIPLKYQLTELVDGSYRQRTKRNVVESDGTLIINLGELDGGSLATQAFALQHGKPCLVVQLDDGVSEKVCALVLDWLREHAIHTLNVAGPRESKRPGIYRVTLDLLDAVDALFNSPARSQ
jgi:hypothetical protein